MIIISTDSLRGYGLNRAFDLAKQAGYDGVDLVVNYGEFDTFNAEYVKKLILEYKLPVHAVTAPNEIAPKRIEEIVSLAKDIGAKVVVLQPPKILDFKMTSWMKTEIPKLREKEAISIALENAPSGTFLGIIPEHAMGSAADLKDFKHVCLDVARLGEQKKDLMRAYTALKKFLVHIHLSNFYHGKKYAPPQEGIMPLESFMTKLKEDGYPGAISMKILPKYLHCGDDARVVKELVKAKKYYEKFYGKVEGGTAKNDKFNMASEAF